MDLTSHKCHRSSSTWCKNKTKCRELVPKVYRLQASRIWKGREIYHLDI